MIKDIFVNETLALSKLGLIDNSIVSYRYSSGLEVVHFSICIILGNFW